MANVDSSSAKYALNPAYFNQLTHIFTDDPELHYIGIQWSWPGSKAEPQHMFNDDRTRTTVSVGLARVHELAAVVAASREQHERARMEVA